MPEIGEIRRKAEVGYKDFGKVIWCACVDCGKERWVQLVKGQAINSRCPSCAHLGKRSALWRGGRVKKFSGYIQIYLYPDDPFRPMAEKSGYVFEHRLVMAKHLGRLLHKTEQVHHIDGKKDNNDISNLKLVSRLEHTVYDGICAHCELRKRVKLLEWQVKRLNRELQYKLLCEEKNK